MKRPAIHLLLGLLSLTTAFAQQVQVQPQPTESEPVVQPAASQLAEPNVEDLQKIASGLASESFQIREKSQAALAKYARQYPGKVKEGLAPSYLDSVDAEVRYRLAEVIYDAVVDEMEHSGFLGIIMLTSAITMDNKLVPSIQVSQVLKDSAADRAGVRAGDQIIQVDDLTFDGVPRARQPGVVAGRFRTSASLELFKDYIGGRKKGTKVKLKLQRNVGGKPRMMEVDVRLGRRTRELMEDHERVEEERFFDQWLKSREAEAKPKSSVE